MHLFTYGTLMFEDIWTIVVSGSYRSRTGTLRGYTRKAVREAEYPVIYPGPADAVVHGRVYFDVVRSDVERLDRFEGSYYSRRCESIMLSGEEVITADVYVLQEHCRHIATDSDWDPDRFRREGIERFRNNYSGFNTSPGTV